MGGVTDVGVVEEVAVVADLETRQALFVGGDHGGNELDVAFAEDTGGADGCC